MYFITYIENGVEKLGVLSREKSQAIDLQKIEGLRPYTSMLDFIDSCGDFEIGRINNVLGDNELVSKIATNTEDIKLCAPIRQPRRNIICLGLNYEEHIDESESIIGKYFEKPSYPVYFGKMASMIIGPGEAINSHREITQQLDYEVELAVVVGKDGTNIAKEQVEDYIFGYSVFNDVSARELQKQHGQWIRGKSLDTFSAMGPYLVHKSEIPFPVQLNISSKINGETRQSSNTKHLIFDLAAIISDLSKGMTLKSGDIIITGTPAGVGMGFNPPKYLKPGDSVECFIEKIGTLKNDVS